MNRWLQITFRIPEWADASKVVEALLWACRAPRRDKVVAHWAVYKEDPIYCSGGRYARAYESLPIMHGIMESPDWGNTVSQPTVKISLPQGTPEELAEMPGADLRQGDDE